ncbi:hypothetical protein BHM03_00028393 [Ensete ventricosum]|nr:hypothetical protein BHM03_00028393 [Ensete ventricosum]
MEEDEAALKEEEGRRYNGGRRKRKVEEEMEDEEENKGRGRKKRQWRKTKRSLATGRYPPKSTVGDRLREKKGRRRRGKEEEEEKKNTSRRPRPHAVTARGTIDKKTAKSKNAILINTTGWYVPIRQLTGTQTARYQAIPSIGAVSAPLPPEIDW